MPIYDFTCPTHGTFTRRASYEDKEWTHLCGKTGPRAEVYLPTFIMEGRSIPRRDDVESVQDEMKKELLKRNYPGTRAIQEVRDNLKEYHDEPGGKYLDTAGMTKQIS